MNPGALENAKTAAFVALKLLEADVRGYLNGATDTEQDFRHMEDCARKLLGTMERVRSLQPRKTQPPARQDRAEQVVRQFLKGKQG